MVRYLGVRNMRVRVVGVRDWVVCSREVRSRGPRLTASEGALRRVRLPIHYGWIEIYLEQMPYQNCLQVLGNGGDG